MERLFDEMMGRGIRRVADEDGIRGSWSPAVNILEGENGIKISADLPGMNAEDVEVTVEDGVLTIRGERRFEEASEGETYHRVERRYGVFERNFTLPNSVDPAKIEARFNNGEMVVSLPKREESKPRSVKVKVETN
jgi:HSP20 family protein